MGLEVIWYTRVVKNGYFFWISKCLWCQKLSLGSLLKKKFFEKIFKTRRPPLDQNFAPTIEISIFENFQNYRRKFFNSSFEIFWNWNFMLKNIKTEHFLIKLISDEIWRPKITDNSFIKKCPVLMLFSIKFPIKWAINELSTIILKIFKNGNFNGGSKSKFKACRQKKIFFSNKNSGTAFL